MVPDNKYDNVKDLFRLGKDVDSLGFWVNNRRAILYKNYLHALNSIQGMNLL